MMSELEHKLVGHILVKVQQILTFHKLPSALWLSKRSTVHCLSAYNMKKTVRTT